VCRALREGDLLADSDALSTADGARAALGEAAYEAAFARGATLGREQALQALTDPL
jgi:hypothetical protein